MFDFRCNKVYKNVLLVIRCGFTYLDFVDVCKRGYGTGAQKYIKYFVILFQDSNDINYAWKTIYLVAYFKYIWKSNFL